MPRHPRFLTLALGLMIGHASPAVAQTKLFDTRGWAAPAATTKPPHARAVVNGTPWQAKGSGYLRAASGNAQVSLSSLGIAFGPLIELNFKSFTKIGRYSVGACYAADCVSVIVKIRGAGLAARTDQSFLEVTEIDQKAGTISAKFTFIFDPTDPPANRTSAFQEGLRFERGELTKVPVDVYK